MVNAQIIKVVLLHLIQLQFHATNLIYLVLLREWRTDHIMWEWDHSFEYKPVTWHRMYLPSTVQLDRFIHNTKIRAHIMNLFLVVLSQRLQWKTLGACVILHKNDILLTDQVCLVKTQWYEKSGQAICCCFICSIYLKVDALKRRCWNIKINPLHNAKFTTQRQSWVWLSFASKHKSQEWTNLSPVFFCISKIKRRPFCFYKVFAGLTMQGAVSTLKSGPAFC